MTYIELARTFSNFVTAGKLQRGWLLYHAIRLTFTSY